MHRMPEHLVTFDPFDPSESSAMSLNCIKHSSALDTVPSFDLQSILGTCNITANPLKNSEADFFFFENLQSNLLKYLTVVS